MGRGREREQWMSDRRMNQLGEDGTKTEPSGACSAAGGISGGRQNYGTVASWVSPSEL